MTEGSKTGTHQLRTWLLSATALAAAVPQAATAQEIAAADLADSETIIVTGTRRETTLLDAPINISAVGADTLQKQRIFDLRDLSSFVNGITIVDTGPRSTGTIVVRGLGAGDSGIGGANTDTAVSTYLGEVPLYLDFKLIDIQRVEVLLGPQGTLYGSGTLAGAIRYIPNRPNADKVEGSAYVKLSTTDNSSDLGYTAYATINTPIVPGKIALRSTFGYFFEPGFIDYNYVLKTPGVSLPQPGVESLGTDAERAANFVRHPDANFERTFTTRNALLVQPSDDLKFILTYAYQKTETDGFQANSAEVMGTGKYENASRYLEPRTRDAHLVSLEVNANLADFAELVSATAVTRQKMVGSTDNTDLLLDLDYDYELFPGFSSYAPGTQRYEQFNQELRLVSKHGGPISWTIGGFYNKFEFKSRRDEYVPGYTAWAGITYRPDDLEYISFVNTKTTEKAVFGEASWQITDAWQVTGGLRYFQYDAFAQGGSDLPLLSGGRRRTPYPLIQFDPSRVRSGDTSDSGTVYKLNTSYKFSDELLIYGTYSTGYRIGGVNRVVPCIIPLPPGQNLCALPDELAYGPDETTNIEIGLKFALFDKRFTGSVAGYHIDWTGIQIQSQTINGAIGILRNASNATSKGVELEFVAEPFDGFTIQGNYAYNDARLSDTAPGIVVTRGGVLVDGEDGDRLPGSAKNQGSIGATYTANVYNDDTLRLNWTATYRGDVVTRVGGRGFGETIPAYTLHRASATYSHGIFEFGMFMNNIFNKYAVTAVGQTTEQQFVNDGVVLRYYQKSVVRPRTFGFEARVRF